MSIRSEVLLNSFALARTVECFCIPRDVLTICVGKSTYAHCGITRKRDAIRAGLGDL
jgi:deoxycytidine triphosphate deaminase